MEENINGELTFRKIWQQIKKSGVRIIVYAIVALIVCGGILGICDIFVSQSQYETTITYYYSGAESGDGPWGGQVNVAADITSASNVSAALGKLQYSDEERDTLVKLVIKNLSVVSAVDETTDDTGLLLSGTYSYRIVLSRNSAMDKIIKARNDYNNILSAITTNYIESFKASYSFSTSLGKLTVVDSYNAFQKYETLNDYLKVLTQESKTWAEMAPSFVSTNEKLSFSALNARVQIASQKLDNYLNFVLFNGINASGESQYVELKLKEASDSIAIYESQISVLNEVLAVLMQGGNVDMPSNGAIIITSPDVESVTALINLAIASKTQAELDKNAWQTRQTYFNSQNFDGKSDTEKQALVDSANALELEAIAEYNSILQTYKAMIEEYNSGYNVSSLVRMTATPTQTTNSPITKKVGLMVELMVLIISIIVAMLVTNKKGAMVLKRKKPATEQEQEVVYEDVEPQGLPSQGGGLGGPVEEVDSVDQSDVADQSDVNEIE